MIKSNELRLGNLAIAYGKHLIKCSGIQGGLFYFYNEDGIEDSYSLDAISPIPLTEEWLLKLGFTSTIKDYYSGNGIELFYTCEGCLLMVNDQSAFSKVYQFVHEIQNLVSALTGEELTIKETV